MEINLISSPVPKGTSCEIARQSHQSALATRSRYITLHYTLMFIQGNHLAHEMVLLGPLCCNKIYLITHICRIKGCGGAGWPPPPPIIFERIKLPQQIIYRRKDNLSESPNHQKYWENILVSRFYEQFSRNRRNLGHFRKFEKISNS